MSEEPLKTWGGKRREGRTQVNFPLRLDNDLFEIINKQAEKGKRNKLVNELIRKGLDN